MESSALFIKHSLAAIKAACPIQIILTSDYSKWLTKQPKFIANQLLSTCFEPKHGAFTLLLDAKGERCMVLQILDSLEDYLQVGALSANLPKGSYYFLEPKTLTSPQLTNLVIGFGLGGYQFDAFKTKVTSQRLCRLVLPPATKFNAPKALAVLEATFKVRDLINMPSEQLYPLALASEAAAIAKRFKARFKVIKGKTLATNFPAVAAVGRGSVREPCLIELNYGSPKHFKLTLVGKGVCFDAGGLDLKSASGMLEMKKDMGGAAHALGLAQIIMQLKLPINLRVLIPAVENLPSGSSYKVRDIIRMRSGVSVEVGNTDAEGRLILADALSLATEASPDLIIDFATLTGAARVALGMDMAALFSNQDALAQNLVAHMNREAEPVWQLPLYQPYKEYLHPQHADLINTTSSVGISGGAITAALFLEAFVKQVPWIHLDFNGSNIKAAPGRPKGGEAICLRGALAFLEQMLAARA